jgi:hypothetical protein
LEIENKIVWDEKNVDKKLDPLPKGVIIMTSIEYNIKNSFSSFSN